MRLAIGLTVALALSSSLAAAPDAVRDNKRILNDSAYKRAGDLLDARRYAEAVQAFSQLLKRYPQASYGYAFRGQAYARLGRFDEAVADMESALKFNAEGAAVFSRAAASVYEARAEAIAGKGDRAAAISDYTRALELDSTQTFDYLERAILQSQLGRYEEAVRDCDLYLAKASDSSYAKLALALQGRAYLKTGRMDSALGNVRRLVALDPRLAPAYGGANALDIYDAERRRGMMQQSLAAAERAERAGDPDEAFRLFQEARQWPLIVMRLRQPDDLPEYNKAEQALDQRVYEALLRLYPKLRSQPGLPEAARRYAIQAETAVRESRYADARSLYGKTLEIAPWWPQAHFNLALLLERESRYVEAIARMKEYIKLTPEPQSAREAQDKIYLWESKRTQAAPRP